MGGMIRLNKTALVSLIVLVAVFSSISALAETASAPSISDHPEVDLEYLSSHMEEFCGMKVKTVGRVRYVISVYMFEDFWLGGQAGGSVPVVVRFAGLPTPAGNSTVEVSGTIEYCNLEGGFYYLSAQDLRETLDSEPPHVTELSVTVIVPLFMIAMALAAALKTRKDTVR